METQEYKTGTGYAPLSWYHDEHRLLEYKRQNFNNASDVAHWREQGYTNDYFTGEMYDMKNEKPDWFDLSVYERVLGWGHLSWSFYKMTPGVILPVHVDTFNLFKQLHKPEGTICRALVFLEDRKPGHYLDINCDAVPRWRAGQFVWWTEHAPHSAGNIGTEDRYTLQLTGVR